MSNYNHNLTSDSTNITIEGNTAQYQTWKKPYGTIEYPSTIKTYYPELYEWGTHQEYKPDLFPVTLTGIWGKSNEEERKEIKGFIMKKLYHVYVIDIKGVILIEKSVVAENADEAKFELDIESTLRKKDLTYKDVTIICDVIADNIKIKEEIEVQPVKIVE